MGFLTISENQRVSHSGNRKDVSVNTVVSTKQLPEEVVVSPQDSVPVPQLGGAAQERAVDTGPGRTRKRGIRQLNRNEQETPTQELKRLSGGTLP